LGGTNCLQAHNDGDLPNAAKEFKIVGRMELMVAATLDQLVPRELFGELGCAEESYRASDAAFVWRAEKYMRGGLRPMGELRCCCES